MPLPRFLDIEYCQTDDTLFPTAMSWSLEDGRLKTVVIAPQDSWIPEDGDLGDIDLLYLEETGVPVIELARELHQDLPDQTVFTDGMDPDEILVDLIFTAVSMEAPFEIAPITELITINWLFAINCRVRVLSSSPSQWKRGFSAISRSALLCHASLWALPAQKTCTFESFGSNRAA